MGNRKFTQWGYLMILFSLIIFCIFWFNRAVFLSEDMASNLPIPPNMIPFFLAIPVLLTILTFYKQTITLSDTTISFSLGIGIISKRFALSDLEQCTAVNNLSFLEMGIHISTTKWVYNLSGKEGVVIQLKNSKKTICIGTHRSEEIAALINQRIEVGGV